MNYRLIIAIASILLATVTFAGSYQMGAFDDRYPLPKKVNVVELLPNGVMQPFREGELERIASIDDAARISPAEGWHALTFADVVALKDYLDEDSVPTSLALPSVERVPMVSVVRLLGGTFSLQQITGPEYKDSENVWCRPVSYCLDPRMFRNLIVEAKIAFPFARIDTSKSFRIQCMVKFFMGSPDMAVRVDGSNGTSPLCATGDWAQSGVTVSDGVVTLVSGEENLCLSTCEPDDVTTITKTYHLRMTGDPRGLEEHPLLKVINRQSQEPSGKCYPCEAQYDVGFHPFNTYGQRELANWSGGINYVEPSGKYVPMFAVWVRVVDNLGKTVDLAPAANCDDTLNGLISNHATQQFSSGSGGYGLPLLRFAAAKPSEGIDWDVNGFLHASLSSTSVDEDTYFTPDPRFNHAPENWVLTSGGAPDFSHPTSLLIGVNGRDTDPYMYCSDSGYLQSVSELSFLPRLGQLSGPNGGYFFDNSARFNGRIRRSVEEIADIDYVWRTYKPASESLGGDGLYEKFVGEERDVHGGITDHGGIKSQTAALELLANPPCTWSAAATNDTNSHGSFPYQFLEKAFCERYGVAREIREESMSEIAATLTASINAALASGDSDWRPAYDALEWFGTNPRSLIGSDLDGNLNSCDRKMLYGFWRDLLGQWRCGAYDVVLKDWGYVYHDAYKGDEWLSAVTFNGHYWYIEERAFQDCVGLTNLTLDCDGFHVSQDAFKGCDNLTRVVVGEDCSCLPSELFEQCTNLTNIVVHASMRHLSDVLSQIAYRLSDTKLTIDVIGDEWVIASDFANRLRLPISLLRIGEGVQALEKRSFYRCTGLEEVQLPSSLHTIMNYAFSGCSSLRKIVIPAGVSMICPCAFEGVPFDAIEIDPKNPYYRIEDGVLYAHEDGVNVGIVTGSPNLPSTYEIPSTVRWIEPYAFKGCTELTSLRIPQGVKQIDEYTFIGCRSLKELIVPESVIRIDPNGLLGVPFSALTFEGGRFLTDEKCLYQRLDDGNYSLVYVRLGNSFVLTITGSVENVQAEAMVNAQDLSTLRFETGTMKNIGGGAFSGCKGLSVLELNEGLESIGNYAFYGCSSLKGVIIPATVKTLGINSFGDCTGLTSIVFEGEPPEGVEESGLLSGGRRVRYPSTLAGAYEAIATNCTHVGHSDNAANIIASNGEAVSVSRGWVDEMVNDKGMSFSGDYRSFVSQPSGKTRMNGEPMYVWEDFVAGTDPTDPTSKFTSKIEIVDGVPKVTWNPDLNEDGAKDVRTYTTYGCREIGGAWVDMDNVPAAEKGDYRFFKVTVEMK